MNLTRAPSGGEAFIHVVFVPSPAYTREHFADFAESLRLYEVWGTEFALVHRSWLFDLDDALAACLGTHGEIARFATADEAVAWCRRRGLPVFRTNVHYIAMAMMARTLVLCLSGGQGGKDGADARRDYTDL